MTVAGFGIILARFRVMSPVRLMAFEEKTDCSLKLRAGIVEGPSRRKSNGVASKRREHESVCSRLIPTPAAFPVGSGVTECHMQTMSRSA